MKTNFMRTNDEGGPECEVEQEKKVRETCRRSVSN
jgi:hypothetical protein